MSYETVQQFVADIEAMLREASVESKVSYERRDDGKWEIGVDGDQAIVLGLPPCEHCGEECGDTVIIWAPTDYAEFDEEMRQKLINARMIVESGDTNWALEFVGDFLKWCEGE